MSSYNVVGTDPNHDITVGWDPPLNTYFVHIIDSTKEEEEEGRDVVWYGTLPGQCHDVEEIVEALRPHVDDLDRGDIVDVITKIYRDANA